MLLGLFLLLLLLIKFSVKFQFRMDDANVLTVLSLGVGGLFLRIPLFWLGKIMKKIRERPYPHVSDTWQGLRLAFRVFDRFAQEVNVFDLEIAFGVGDPFWTALSCGGLWALLNPFIIGGKKLKEQPRISVNPEFQEPALRISFYCIFSFRLGQIILDGLKALARTLVVGI